MTSTAHREDRPQKLSSAPENLLSVRSQTFVVWWAIVITLAFGLALAFLLRMFPPPSATLSAEQVADIYKTHSTAIKIGATICSWTSAFMVPLWIVVAIQIRRQEPGRPIWTMMALIGGCVNSVVLVLPPIFWGVAAFAPGRSADVTATLHQLGIFTFVSTDQWYMFNWLAVIVISLRKPLAPHSPFPRWFGYYSVLVFLDFLPGALCFNFRTGPFAWNGLLVFWIPASTFFVWMFLMAVLLLKALKLQRLDAEKGVAPTAVEPLQRGHDEVKYSIT